MCHQDSVCPVKWFLKAALSLEWEVREMNFFGVNDLGMAKSLSFLLAKFFSEVRFFLQLIYIIN